MANGETQFFQQRLLDWLPRNAGLPDLRSAGPACGTKEVGAPVYHQAAAFIDFRQSSRQKAPEADYGNPTG